MSDDMGAVISAVQQYGDDRVASETADLKGLLNQAEDNLATAQATIQANIEALAEAKTNLDIAVASGLAKDKEILRLQARVNELEAQLNPVVTQFGFSNPMATSGSVAPVRVYRTYLQPRADNNGQPSSVVANSGLMKALGWLAQDEDAVLWLSYKQPVGTWFHQLLSDIEEKFPVQQLFITCWHEPFKEWAKTDTGTYGRGSLGTPDDWHAKQDEFLTALGQHSDRWIPHTVWEQYRRPSNTRQYYDDFYRVDQRLGFDAYNAGIQSPKVYQAPELVFDEILSWAADHTDQPVGIAETGTGRTATDTSRDGQYQWHMDTKEYLASPDRPVKISAAAIWNSEGCTVDSRTFNAWQAAL